MSSNIKVQRICQLCGIHFTAQKTITKFYSHRCASRAYKIEQKSLKIESSNQETQKLNNLINTIIENNPADIIRNKEFLSVQDLSKLLNCSTHTTYRLIKSGKIKAVNLGQRKTIIKRTEIDKIFQ
jgi:excisionase family DNA binding protein